ncbi:MAG TPA: glycoside hydrolase family 15 protein [Flavisolibacter sp.]|nr:glycoside hydrolase family 15 protein [Flavisolibacter sp.]
MSYQPIENYGIIGDLNTIALVGLNGSIDYMCFPNFDSPSLFAALLDEHKGGRFQIIPAFSEMKTKQIYVPDTNVLLTRFLSRDGVGEITDFMPVEELYNGKELIRRVTTVRGEVTYNLTCEPRFDYARASHKVELLSDKEALFTSNGDDHTLLRLVSSVPLKVTEGSIQAQFTLKANETADFMLEHVDHAVPKGENLQAFITESLFHTINYWKEWVAQSSYKGRWMEIVNRSALVLKLLTSYKFGSIVAAPTFSLPESIGNQRNWDYRFTWIRDASFTVYSLLKLGYTKEAGAFMAWVEKLCSDIKEHNRLGIMYSIDGKPAAPETILDLEGYRQSAPVRIGNNAYNQLQLDIYGELMDSVYLYNKYGDPISYDFWKDLEQQINWLAANWQQPDEGIWEVRGGKQQFLYSRFMSWVAIDRAIKLAESRSFPLQPHWKGERDAIHDSIYKDFWNEELQAFMQYPGSATVDASALLMPLARFISPKDPRWLSTLKRIENELVSDSLVYRYRTDAAAPDGLMSHEGTFSMCTFWYVECLSRSGQLDKARFYFEKMLGYANHLGLFAEQLGFEGEHLGNFPQAFTHLGLISAAYNLDRQLNDKRNRDTTYDL